MYQIVFSPRVADASPICTIMGVPHLYDNGKGLPRRVALSTCVAVGRRSHLCVAPADTNVGIPAEEVIAHYNPYRSCVLSEGCAACNFLHHVQGLLHLMQGLPAGANTRPMGGVNLVFVRTNTLLALTQKSTPSTEKYVTTFPCCFDPLGAFHRASLPSWVAGTHP